MIDTIIIFLIFITLTFWAYCNLFYQNRQLKYAIGYLIFSQFNWLFILINLIWLLGWIIGFIAFIILYAGGLVLLTNYTTNKIYGFLNINSDTSLAVFSVTIWILFIATIIKIFL